MIDFTKLTTKKRLKIFDEKKSIDFVVDRITLGFETIESDMFSLDYNQPFELPKIIRDRQHLIEILSQAQQSLKGRWERTVAITYFLGGKVIYTKLNDDKFKARLTF